jgi:homoisocitrate dehydrogenase
VELCVIAGDGIGPEVVPAALRVLQAAVPDVVAHEMRAGWDCFQETGSPLPEETVACALAAGAVLFGAASSPSHPVEGYYSPVVRLRRVLDTYAAIRPTRFLPVPTAREGVDLIVVRENTEDTYAGTERVEADASAATTEKIVSRQTPAGRASPSCTRRTCCRAPMGCSARSRWMSRPSSRISRRTNC